MSNNTQIAPRLQMEGLIKSSYWQESLRRTLGENAGTFSTSLIELYSEDNQLAQCDPKMVIKQAMLAGTVKLPISKQIGFAYMTVFKNKGVPTPTLMISTRGFIQLAQRSGKYKLMNADVVYEGQVVKKNFMTGEFEIQEERISDKVVGFFAYIKTIDNFEKTLYMSLEQMCHHAKIYSAAIKFDKGFTEQNLADLIQKTAKEGPVAGVVGWKGNPIAMGIKTVLKQLIYKYGPMSIEIAKAVAEEGDDAWDNAYEVRSSANKTPKEVIEIQEPVEVTEIKDTTDSSTEDCPV